MKKKIILWVSIVIALTSAIFVVAKNNTNTEQKVKSDDLTGAFFRKAKFR